MKRHYENCIKQIEAYYWFFFLILSILIAFLCFRCLGIKYIDSWDEARHGISAYEMMQNKNYLVNTYLGEADYWNVKPPLSFLSIIAGFSIFGYNAVGLRFFSALSYLLTSICTGLFAKRYSKLASLLSMLFLACNYLPFKAHLVRAGDADALYLLWFTLAILAMLKISQNQKWLPFCGLCFSLAFLTKSFHAAMIAAVGGLFLLFSGEIKKISWKIWGVFLLSSTLPILIWGILRYQYDGFTFFLEMYKADIAGRTAAGGLEGHGFPFDFYFTSIFQNFDYIYGWLFLVVLLGILYLWIRPLRTENKPMPKQDQLGLFLWFFVPLLGFSLVSTKLLWYVYPCIIPLILLSSIFLAEFLKNPKLGGIFCWLSSFVILYAGGTFLWNNYLDNVRGAKSNDLQTFLIEQCSRDGEYTGSRIYLDAYDPFLYANTTNWEQNNLLLAMLEGDMDCQNGGAAAFLEEDTSSLLILSIPFLENYPELQTYEILADNGQYLLIAK